MPRKLPTRVLALVAAGFLFGGVAAALDGDDTNEPETSEETTTTTVETFDDEVSATEAEGPDATGPAKFGLCTAYAAGQGTENGNKADSTAFQALAAAAEASPGDTDEARIEAFCADVLDDDAPGNSSGENGNDGENGQSGENHGGGNDTADDASGGKAGGQSSDHQP